MPPLPKGGLSRKQQGGYTMKTKRITLCIALALLFMVGTFRTGCRIIVNGTVLPGVYDLAAAQNCAAMAQRTAEEITPTREAPPFRLIPVLCHRREVTDEVQMYHLLLESYEGVEKLYAVSVQGRQVGLLDDLWEVSALLKEYPAGSIQITHIYSHPEAADSLRHVRAALMELQGETVDF